jgi:hypothetical protein
MPIYEYRELFYDKIGVEGFTTGALEDRLLAFLINAGHTDGSLDDRFLAWLEIETSATGSLPDLLRKKYIDGGYGSLGEALTDSGFF